MADSKHVERLTRSVDKWNDWRQQHPEIRPDLSHAILTEANLRGALLSDTDLTGADLRGALLPRADLRGALLPRASLNGTLLSEATLTRAYLMGSILTGADLTGADLAEADLSRANLTRVSLTRASLTRAYLIEANLIETKLSGSDLTQAHFSHTTFAWVDLSSINGLETAIHDRPSIVDINSVILPFNEYTRKHFLRGTGFSDHFIDYLPSLLNTPIQYQSCFISYSSKDDLIARKLHTDLQKSGVRCWFAPHDLKWGERIRTGIDQALHLHERVLLILSRHALASGWVEQEVKKALSRERKQKRSVLFPIRVDKAILESPLAWATKIRHECNIGDFSRWKDDESYQKAFSHLLRDLKMTRPPTF